MITRVGLVGIVLLMLGGPGTGFAQEQPPHLTAVPLSILVTAGGTANFAATAIGTPPLSFQWTFDGTNLAGATAASYTLPEVTTAHAGLYAVTVSNAFGVVTSPPARLEVNALTSRVLQLADANTNAQGQVEAVVRLGALGDENRVAFSLAFDPAVLSNPSVQALYTPATNASPTLHGLVRWSGGLPAGSTLSADLSAVGAGRLGLAFALPAGTNLLAGRRDLARVTFDLAAGRTVAEARFGFADVPVGRTVLDAAGTNLVLAAAVQPSGTAGPAPVAPSQQSGLFSQWLTVRNPAAVAQAVRVVVLNLGTDARTNTIVLFNASGYTNGLPYFEFGPLGPGASATLTAEYYIPDRTTVPAPQFDVQSTVIVPPTLIAPNNFIASTNRLSPAGEFIVEFATLANGLYYVQYNADLAATNDWKTVFPSLLGTGSRVQWIDSGPPKTESLPSATRARFYRIVQY